MELLAEQLAAPLPELEARICDASWNSQPRPIDPHMLTQARKDLENSGLIEPTYANTRGGSTISIWQPTPTPRGKGRATTDAAARKRLLMARWHSWGKATAHQPNLIGQGGEVVVHRSLHAASPTGYRLIQPTRGEVSTIYGQPVRGGSLDNAAWLTLIDAQTQAPKGTILVVIEVKNVRTWLYPTRHEPFQLLEKAANLASEHQEHPVLPVLICRKAHARLRWLASDLGFQIFETHDQYVHPSERINIDHFEEVRTELGFADLQISSDARPSLVTWLTTTLQSNALAFSQRWTDVGRHHADTYHELRQAKLSWSDRTMQLGLLRDAVGRENQEPRNWAGSVEEEDGPPF